jgi:excisionase family DNA binding protein
MKGLAENDRLLTTLEVCDLLGVKETTVYRLRSSGALPYIKLRGSIRMRLSEVEKLLEESTVRL